MCGQIRNITAIRLGVALVRLGSLHTDWFITYFIHNFCQNTFDMRNHFCGTAG